MTITLSTFPEDNSQFVTISRQFRVLGEEEIKALDKYVKDNKIELKDVFKFETQYQTGYVAFHSPIDGKPVCYSIELAKKLFK